MRDKKPKIEGFKRFLKKNFKEISEQEINSIPQFFIDSVEARNPNSNLRPYLNQIIDWSSELSPVIESLGNIVNVDKVIKNKIEEIEKNYININNLENDANGLILYEGMLIKAESDIRNHIRVSIKLIIINK